MTQLPLSSEHCDSQAFKHSLKLAIENLDPGSLPLHSFTTQGGQVDNKQITATIMQIDELEKLIHARVGIFFTEVVGGCSCGDDPYSVNAYGELLVVIDPVSADASFTAVD